VGALAVEPVSGRAFNLAVGVGVTVLGLADKTRLGLYLIADFAGGAVPRCSSTPSIWAETGLEPLKATTFWRELLSMYRCAAQSW
jgi:hypothetical protein